MAMRTCVFFLCVVSISSGFKVTQFSQVPDQQDFRTGENLYLVCKSDNEWERCSFKHKPPGAAKEAKYCNQEWKRASGSVQFTDCPMRSRVKLRGNYKKRECGIEIIRLQLDDAGTWECEMEEYKAGDWWSGPKHRHHFEAITVRNRFTPSVIVPNEKNKDKKVGEKEVEEEEEISKDGDIELEPAVPHKEVEKNEESEHPGSGQAPPEERLEDGFQMQNGTEFGLGNNSTEEVVWHQNTEGGELAGSSVGPIVGGVIAAIALVASVVVGVFLWTRKKKSLTVISMNKLRESDDRSQANAFLEEAEYNATMPGEGTEHC